MASGCRQSTGATFGATLLSAPLILSGVSPGPRAAAGRGLIMSERVESETHPAAPRRVRKEAPGVRLTVRFAAEDIERIRTDADMAGLTAAEFVRRRALGNAIIPHTDRTTINELRRIGGLLKHVHNESHGAYSKDTAEALKVLIDYMKKLAAGGAINDRQTCLEPGQ